MSKTVRRKKRDYFSLWWHIPKEKDLKIIDGVLHEYSSYFSGFIPIHSKNDRGLTIEEYTKKKVRLYHSDKHKYNAPANFRRGINRVFRNRQKQSLKKSLIEIATDEVLFEPFKKTANWEWF